MTFPLSWPERLYGLVLIAYPAKFRHEYEDEMRRVFRELLRDDELGRGRLFRMVAADLVHGLARREHLPGRGLVLRSALFGVIVVAFSLGAQLLHPGQYVGFTVVPVPFLAFIAAGFWGARRTGTIAGGMWVCVVIGLVSSTMLLWDKLVFGLFPFYSVYDFAFSFAIVASYCLVPGLVGAIAGSATSSHEESAS